MKEAEARHLCQHHPDVDYRHAWGCPDCLRELRHQKQLAAGPVMPEAPSEKVTTAPNWLSDRESERAYRAFRAALAEEQGQ